MPSSRQLGELERRVMEQLWKAGEPQTVRHVHAALALHRDLAYNTVMTVLRRLVNKELVVRCRGERAHRYVPVHGREVLVAALMVEALDHASDAADRAAALVHFVARVGPDELCALRRALAQLQISHAAS